MYHPCSHHLSLGIQWNNLALLCSFCQFLKFLGCESGMYSGKELIKSAWVLWVFDGKLNLASSLYVVQSLSRVQLKPHEVQHARLPCLTISWYGLLMLWTLSSRFLSSFSVIIDDGIRYFPSMRFTTTWGAFSDTPVGWWGHCGSLHPWWDFSGKLEPRRFPNGTWCGLFVQGLYSPSHWPCLMGGGISGEGKGWARCGAEQEVAGR